MKTQFAKRAILASNLVWGREQFLTKAFCKDYFSANDVITDAWTCGLEKVKFLIMYACERLEIIQLVQWYTFQLAFAKGNTFSDLAVKYMTELLTKHPDPSVRNLRLDGIEVLMEQCAGNTNDLLVITYQYKMLRVWFNASETNHVFAYNKCAYTICMLIDRIITKDLGYHTKLDALLNKSANGTLKLT